MSLPTESPAALFAPGLTIYTGPSDEDRRVFDAWNQTDAPYPADRCIHQLFEEQAARTPDAVAAVCEDRSLTYAELNAAANRLAHHLRGLGVRDEARVGIGLQRGLEMLVAMLAVLKAGGAYVPLDPAYPADRLAFTLRDARVEVLLTQDALRDQLPVPEGMHVVSVDESAAAIARESAENPAIAIQARNLAYLIYTSGSTGVPKGVAIEHESAVVMLAWATSVYTAEEMGGMLACTSICFDLSVYELFLPLSVGGRVIIVENALALPHTRAASQVRLLNTVPSAAAALLKSGGIPSWVKTVNLAGEPLRTELVNALYAHGVEKVYDLYGPSEDTTYSTWTLRQAHALANIGKPLSNTQAYILDPQMRLLPLGQAGELYLAGKGLTRGYLGRYGLTAEKYLPDPFGSVPGGRMYRTGDRVRWNADGTLEYLGRLDAQVKIRGFRVELGEIESALRRHPDVREGLVVAREDEMGEKRLAAYIVGTAKAEALRAHLRKTLPEHFVPSVFVTLEEMPLTPNGKLDRKALPAPDFSQSEEEYVAPRTPTEEALCETWALVLGLGQIGIRDNVFHRGAHSLLATRVVARIAEAFGVTLTVRAVFDAPTVEQLAQRVDAGRETGRAALPPVVRVPRDGAMPLSFGQERLWFLDRVEPGKAAYNVAAVARLSGELDFGALERALGEIVRRHEALRTTFPERGGAAVQSIAPFAGFALPIEDISSFDDPRAEAERRILDEAALPFDLATGPLYRAQLLWLAEGEHVLLQTMHHALSDGWSMDVLYRELGELYTADVEGREPALAEPALQYADFAAWQQVNVRGAWVADEVAWWARQLAGAPALLDLPTDRPRPAVQTYVGGREEIVFPVELAERLESLGRRHGGASLYMVVLAAWQVLLGRYAGMDDVLVASPIAGRTRPEVENVIGFFTNTLALRTDLSGDPRFSEVLRRVREVTLGAYEHQDVPLEQVVRAVQPGRSLSHAPLFQVMFVLQTGGAGPRMPGVTAAISETHPGTAKLDLTLSFTREPDALTGYLEFSTDLFERATARRMVGHLRTLLEQVAEDADVPLSRVRLLDDAERRTVVEEWNRTDAAFDAGTMHALFEAQADRTPNADAVRMDGVAFSYTEIEARANRLANHLRRRGVGPEVRVAVCLEPGVEMIVSILGVLKAGGAYVPMDPAAPAERLRMMLTDSGVAMAITQRSLADSLPVAEDVGVLCVDSEAAEIAVESADRPNGGAGARSLAYVIYTSGSTGVPKGVGVEHRGVCNLVPELIRILAIEPGSRSLLLAPLHFDASVAEIFSALAAGAALHLPDAASAVPGPEMLELLRRESITHTKFTPSALSALPEAQLPALRTLVVGGEACTAELVARWGRDRRFVNVYGPTEATVRVSAAVCAPEAGTPSIGAPLANTRLYVLDAAGAPEPVGVPGELYVGGVQLARGYLGRPALTAASFVPDAFGAEAGGRLYRTGDRVRWTAAGTLEYLGRLDQQVKIRGYRIELGEVDATLRGHAEVRDCAVIAREDVPGDRRLVAYVVGDADAETLRAHLRRSLPEYMVPAAFVAMETLPLTPNGKLDRRALPAPDFAVAAERYVAPRTPVEEVLAGIWAEMLRVERVGAHDDFFQLGGHSLMATRLVWRMGDVFGVTLSVRVVLESPTLAQLAERVEAARNADAVRLAPIVPVTRTEAMPLSFAQERLWFLDQLEGGSTAYNVPAGLRLRGALNVAALERALGEIVRRHEVLRTTLVKRGGGAVQVVAPFAGFALATEDLTALDAAEREVETALRIKDKVVTPFELSAGPLFRARLLRMADDEHVLLMVLHHAVTDGWSMGVIYRELSALYAAFAAGEESPLGELPVQYADYATWQREQLRGEVLDRELAWWKSQLSSAPALLELPTDHPRPAVQTYRGADEAVVLDADLLAPLQALARAEGATLYMVLLAAFQVLLGRYAGSEDVVVGSPIAGRTRPEVEELIGFFVNTLVLRTDLSGEPAFREVLRRVRTTTLGAYEHQEVPFERLVEELSPGRSLSHTPLFQVMFTLGATAALPSFGEVSTERVDADLSSAKFDLHLALMGDGAGMEGVLQYSTDLFDRATVQRMLGHLRRVLEQVAADADQPISQLDLLADAEREVVVEAWNATEAPYATTECIHTLFEAQAARTPNAAAATSGTETITYAELNAKANRLAHHLRAMGVGAETRVGICQSRGIEMLVSMVAVLKSGGAYVPLDPAYPADRLAFILRDARVAVLLTQESLADLLPVEHGVRVVCVDVAQNEIAAESSDNLPCVATPRNLGYLIYTSGSTGVPKGVAIEHESAVALLSWAADLHTAEELGGMLACTSICFDLSIYEFFLPLSRGGRMIIVENALALTSAPAAADVRLVNTVPSAAAALLKIDGIPAGVTTVNLAGEPLRTELVDALYGRGIQRVIDLYGPSEDTTYSTWTLRQAGAPATIGRPIANTRAYILDSGMRPVPVGVPGELYLGGRGLARGYLGRPALTADRFIPDHLGAEAGGRLYRTGDRVRWTSAGNLEYLGRLDAQVKVRGYRIELGELETTLRKHADVRDCVVMAPEVAPGDRRLVAYVAGDADAETLRSHLRKTLPEYMVPAAFMMLDALPLNPNGKLDRKALPAADFGAVADEYVAPRTPMEEMLAGIWAEMLGIGRVGIHDNFFSVGGHSLLAIRLVARIGDVFGAGVSVRALFEAPTVAELAERVEAARNADAPRLAPVVPVARTDAMPLSFAQERLWFLDQLQPGSAFYNVPAAFRLSGALSVPALEQALWEIVHRHEVLRTTLRGLNGGAVQTVAPFAGFVLAMEDLSDLPADVREAEMRHRAGVEATRPFDLATGPLFRAALLRLADDEHVLLITLHHAVTDGWSMGVLYRELSALYAAFADGAESPLVDLPVQYADYATWQREQLRGEVLDRELAWWKSQLSGAPALLELPTDHPRPAVQTYRGADEAVVLDADLLAPLQALARSEGATLYMVLLAAFQVLLGRYAGSEDVVVGSPIAGRTRPEVEELIGFFVNTLVLRTDLSGEPAFREVLRRVRTTTLGAYEHQEVPFERLVEELSPGRSLSHTPLFQVMFTLGATAALPSFGEVSTERVDADLSSAKFDLHLALMGDAAGMEGVLQYSTDLFDRATVQRMLGHLRRVLEQVAVDADQPISQLDLLADAEREVVVEAWNATEAPYSATECIHTLFEAQVARTPNATAATAGTETVTYTELNAKANRLAHHLRALGVGAETRVGICQSRGIEMLVSMLAVLKSGGAYVPLDPAYPADRLAFILRDARVAVLLTQQSLADLLPVEDGVRVVCVDMAQNEIAAESSENVGVAVSPRNLGYLIYTSGSTGVPKGVAIEHESAVALLSWAADLHTAEELGGMLACTSICFDLSIYEFFLPLSRGGRMIIVENALALTSAPAAADVRLVNTVPSAAAALLKIDGIPAGVTTVNLAGEPLRTELVDALYARGIHRVIDLYGPSEDTTYSTWTLRQACAPATIGRPIANTRAYILDSGMRPVPVGVPGELYLGGRGLARGYLGRPALTADRFIPDHLGAEAGGRLYRTGDRVRWTSAGNLEYLGRLDAQVKVRGYRIELGELETTLRKHADVRDCVVMAPEVAPGDRRLVAYVAGDADAETLRSHLRKTLPEYMVPAAFMMLDALPLNPNGKLDRKALPAADFGAVAADEYVAPRNEVEQALAEIWAEMLEIGRVGIHDDFFALGGHSLLATRLVWRIQSAMSGDIDLVALFENPTIAGLAPRLSIRTDAPAATPAAASEEQLLAMIDDLSDEELDRLLGANPEIGTFQ
jgi:amino acid adenylation domain-containing protein